MTVLLAPLPGCVMFDTTPAFERLAVLTDEDADGYTLAEGDCNDHDPSVHPDAVDDCDGHDTNCDGTIDEAGSLEPLCRDDDGDGHGDPLTASSACELAEGRVLLCDDCDDHDSEVSPAAAERCDGFDNNCDQVMDGDDAVDRAEWYRDLDGDGYGDDVSAVRACTAPDGYIATPGDCDDREDSVHPGAEEVCGDGADTNCDGDTSACGFWGDATLDPDVVDPTAGAFVRGASEYQLLADSGVQIVDTLSDGTGDVVLLTPALIGLPERADIWYSAPIGEATPESAHLSVLGPSVSYFGSCGTTPILDVDEDGWDDLLLCAPLDMEGFGDGGHVFALPVGTTGDITLGAELEALADPVHWGLFGRHIAVSVSLVGEPALVVSSYEGSYSTEDRGLIRVYTAPMQSGDLPVSSVTGARAGDDLGGWKTLVSDVDVDGFDDLVATVQPEGGTLGGSVRVFHGPLPELADADDAGLVIEGPSLQQVGYDVSVRPDLNGDGEPELFVGSNWRADEGDAHLASWLPGGVKGTANVITNAELTWVFDAENPTPLEVVSGDINGDGELDLVAGAPGMDDDRGAVYGYYGPIRMTGREEFTAQSSFVRRGAEPWTTLGDEVAVGDVNADGTDDLLFFGMADPDEYVGGAWFLFGEGI